MKVLLINGSPHENGSTNRALEEVANAIRNENIEADIFWIGKKPLSGCIACYSCAENKKCIFDDKVNEALEIIGDYDGLIVGSPVHYASAGGAITSFMDRLFYADALAGKRSFYLKPAAAVATARRAGTTATLDQINKYFSISQMPIVSSHYWNMVHGTSPEDVEQDLEGLQIMRTLGKNMAWFLKVKEAGTKAGVELPKVEEKLWTNFIR